MMNKRIFIQHISNASFKELFIQEMGWDNTKGQTRFDLDIEGTTLQFTQIAVRSGFQVLTCQVEIIPTSSLAKKIDTRLRRQANDYICIFHKPGSEHHLWVVPVKKVEKRDLVLVEYETAEKAQFLLEKMDNFTFAIDEFTTIMDVKERVQGAFAINSDKITSDFYKGFRKEHANFTKFISGIEDNVETKNNRNKQWYASVMLNRLMFCYFIQKKGFLDLNVNYLREKLEQVRKEQGNGQFYTFYKGFLVSLFHDGLNSPRHNPDFMRKYGRIPYLNGGMFDIHELETRFPNIDIKDEAFISLFAFFDQWHWHLDDRLTASGKDINPDVLGYIFEQYINDRAQMGAYYTKEDITEYIGKNCILPFLMDKVLTATKDSKKYFRPNGYVWQTLAQSGDNYINPAMKRGFTEDWQERIPDYIAQGIDTNEPNLLERRSRWNERTTEVFALPTEIWRETVERLQRCSTLLEKIYSGDITEINDFITYNLDIRQFVYDLLLNADDHHFVAHFYHALQKVTILDPTCGSGAFLFAAMNILEPLYEICIERMEQWHDENPNLFKDELEEMDCKYRSNRQYFIYKSIILRNLYGVDIMVEATEIAKLRLFLKMVAVVEVDMRADNLGLDPLPDIDFNIRCGNTLVGYATEAELERDLT
ncbi:MAG: SAM-dependent methyltransferase, partial [Prevotella sp.]|nr:SAM-dependent methyltransferase [Prevotella sp.]